MPAVSSIPQLYEDYPIAFISVPGTEESLHFPELTGRHITAAHAIISVAAGNYLLLNEEIPPEIEGVPEGHTGQLYSIRVPNRRGQGERLADAVRREVRSVWDAEFDGLVRESALGRERYVIDVGSVGVIGSTQPNSPPGGAA